MILEEYDSTQTAIINPADIVRPVENMPHTVLACFSHITFDRMRKEFKAEKIIAETNSAAGVISVYECICRGERFGMVLLPVGASASVGVVEEIYAMGAETFAVFGNCGVLDHSIEDCGIIIPISAVRDEGTSYHYFPASDEIAVNTQYKDVFENILDKRKIEYTEGKTWTTDGFYRETADKAAKRRKEGCVCVEMECSALAAAAKFRKKEFFEFFYAGDNLDAEEWEQRSLGSDVGLEKKDSVCNLAVELAAEIEKRRQ
jgi:nucleoside phosphorylase